MAYHHGSRLGRPQGPSRPAVQQERLTDRKLRREPVHSRRAKIICKSKSERALLAGRPRPEAQSEARRQKANRKSRKTEGRKASSRKQEAGSETVGAPAPQGPGKGEVTQRRHQKWKIISTMRDSGGRGLAYASRVHRARLLAPLPGQPAASKRWRSARHVEALQRGGGIPLRHRRFPPPKPSTIGTFLTLGGQCLQRPWAELRTHSG